MVDADRVFITTIEVSITANFQVSAGNFGRGRFRRVGLQSTGQRAGTKSSSERTVRPGWCVQGRFGVTAGRRRRSRDLALPAVLGASTCNPAVNTRARGSGVEVGSAYCSKAAKGIAVCCR